MGSTHFLDFQFLSSIKIESKKTNETVFRTLISIRPVTKPVSHFGSDFLAHLEHRSMVIRLLTGCFDHITKYQNVSREDRQIQNNKVNVGEWVTDFDTRYV